MTDCRTQTTTSNLTATVDGEPIILATLPSNVKSMLANDISRNQRTGYRKGYDLTLTLAEATSMIEFQPPKPAIIDCQLMLTGTDAPSHTPEADKGAKANLQSMW